LLALGIDAAHEVDGPLDGREEAVATRLPEGRFVHLRHVAAEQRRGHRDGSDDDEQLGPSRSGHESRSGATRAKMRKPSSTTAMISPTMSSPLIKRLPALPTVRHRAGPWLLRRSR